jgi:hypothetical protein
MAQPVRTALLRLKAWWMSFARLVGWINTRILLTAVYFLLFALPALFLKLFGKDLLERRWDRNAPTYWKQKPPYKHTVEEATHQF